MNKQNFSLTIFVGDTDASLAQAAQIHNPQAFLIDYNNFNDFIQSELSADTTVYTALGDLPHNSEDFFSLCLCADQIFYIPPDRWSDRRQLDVFDPAQSLNGYTEHLLLMISNHVPVYGLNIPNLVIPFELVDTRKTQHPQLWVAGCSFSHGVGVDLDQRYGSILAKQLGMECSFLTRPGGAIDWASDQIIRSDIGADDIVIFGVTASERLIIVDNNRSLRNVNAAAYRADPQLEKVLPRNILLSENTFFQHTLAIERVINFCHKAKARLILIGLLAHISPNLLRFLVNKKNFFQYPYKLKNNDNFCFADLGSDLEHPGPRQHQFYADFIKNICLQAALR